MRVQNEFDEQAFTDNEVNTADKETYLTKHATEIAKVLGTTKELREFDSLRSCLKSSGTISKDDKQKHHMLLYKLQLAVQRKRTSLLREMSEMEKQYFLHHNQLPQPTECESYDNLLHQCRHINKLLIA